MENYGKSNFDQMDSSLVNMISPPPQMMGIR